MLYTPTRFLCHEDKSKLKFENKLLLFYTFEGKKIAWWKIIILLKWLIKIEIEEDNENSTFFALGNMCRRIDSAFHSRMFFLTTQGNHSDYFYQQSFVILIIQEFVTLRLSSGLGILVQYRSLYDKW